MTELHLVVRLAGERVAFAGDAVSAVIECGAVTPVPRAPAHVLGISALRGRVVTLIDAAAALGLGKPVAVLGEAVLLTVDGHGYGLVVDAIEDAIEASPRCDLPPGIARRWAAAASGVIEFEGELVLVIDPARLIEEPAARVA